MSTPLSVVSNVSTEKDTTKFSWTVGRFKSVRFGDAVQMNTPVIAGGQKWKMALFPKGILEADWASLYVTNIECSMDEGDPMDKNKITSSTLASIVVRMVPKPPNPKKGGGAKPQAGTGEKATGSGGSVIAASSTGGSVASSGARSSKSGSARSAGQKSAVSASGDMSKGQPQVIEKKLSQQFTNKEPSWGWAQFLDLDKLFNTKSGYLNNGEVRDSSNIQDGQMELTVEILAITGIDMDSPETDTSVTPSGCERTTWTIRDFCKLTSKVDENQKLSSAEFFSDGDWFFDIFAKGYRPKNAQVGQLPPLNEDQQHISFFLHSTRSQVTLPKPTLIFSS
jgi:hypothetical protein